VRQSSKKEQNAQIIMLAYAGEEEFACSFGKNCEIFRKSLIFHVSSVYPTSPFVVNGSRRLRQSADRCSRGDIRTQDIRKKMFDLASRITHNWIFASVDSLMNALVAQLVERVLGKDEVGGSTPLGGSIFLQLHFSK
jgi:hypothetical protein